MKYHLLLLGLEVGGAVFIFFLILLPSFFFSLQNQKKRKKMKMAQCFSSNKPQKSVPSFAKLLFLPLTKPKKKKKRKRD
jgi:hypothetical protein